MVLAHSVVERVGHDLAVELLDVIDGDALLRADQRLVVEQAAKLLEHEFGEEVEAAHELRGVLQNV